MDIFILTSFFITLSCGFLCFPTSFTTYVSIFHSLPIVYSHVFIVLGVIVAFEFFCLFNYFIMVSEEKYHLNSKTSWYGIICCCLPKTQCDHTEAWF